VTQGKETTVSDHFGAEFWNERYGSHVAVWSGRPNSQLVAETADLAPGTALDAGCGEGADAIWLAERGWQVTAVDFAATALQKAAAHAEATGVAERVNWVRADLIDWVPERTFDLVSSQFIHLPMPARQAMFRQLAAAVAPGGTLVVVGHHPSDLETAIARPPLPDLFFTAEDVTADLAPDQWEIVVAEARPREEREIMVRDTILHAQRRP
jgi:2-polyprenyl-3-methyl-5-hydroxy-6-metoxy-1,4-benzoquinol methylase